MATDTTVHDLAQAALRDWEAQKRLIRSGKHIIQRTHPNAKLPTRSYPDDIGLDVYSLQSMGIPAHAAVLVSTGIKIQPADGIWLQIESRSGLASQGLSVIGGIIDHKYRGEVKVVLVNHSALPYNIGAGDKVAQLVERPILIHEVEEGTLDETERGANGFGSSGR